MEHVQLKTNMEYNMKTSGMGILCLVLCWVFLSYVEAGVHRGPAQHSRNKSQIDRCPLSRKRRTYLPGDNNECKCSTLREQQDQLDEKVCIIMARINDGSEALHRCPFAANRAYVTCHDTEVINCTGLVHTADHDTLDASDDMDAGICLVRYIPTADPIPCYSFTVDLKSETIGSSTKGHPGLVFNVMSHTDFDFVFFRTDPSEDEACIQHGHVTRGMQTFTDVGDCTGNPIPQESYFQAKVAVGKENVTVLINNATVAEFDSFHMSQSSVGIMTLNTHGNKISFRNIIWPQRELGNTECWD